MDQEEWLPCPKFTKYEVSSLGRFRNAKTHRITKTYINVRTGRRFVMLYIGGRNNSKSAYSAALIATAYIGPRPEGMQVDHIDGIKTHEHIENLQWVDQQMNIQRSYDNGQHPNRKSEGGKLTEADYDEVFALSKQGLSQVAIGKIKKISNSTVSKILNHKIHPLVRKPKHTPKYQVVKIARRMEQVEALLKEKRMGSGKLAKVLNVSNTTARRYLRRFRNKAEHKETHGTGERSGMARDPLKSP